MGQRLNHDDRRRPPSFSESDGPFQSGPHGEDAFHQQEVNCLRLENLQLKCFVSRCHAELMELKVAASHAGSMALDPEPSIFDLTEKLRLAAEALEEANTVIRQTVKEARHLAKALDESRELLRRKDMLNREIDHRVKNSLQLAVSLLRIQANRQRNAPAITALRLAGNRVEAIARIHDLLQAGGDAQSLDFTRYLRELGASLATTAGIDGRHRTLVVEAEPMTLPADTAQALALAINELVTNAFQHAFTPDRPGTVWIQCAVDADGTLSVTVADDGKGLPNDFQLDGGAGPERGSGLGFQLVAMMSAQIGARLDVGRRGGAHFTFTLPGMVQIRKT